MLVTRPRPDAEATAVQLAAMGFAPVLLPLTQIVAAKVEQAPEAGRFDAVAVTSANAIRHLPAPLAKELAGKPVFAVGDSTADAARAAGFVDVCSACGTAVDLAALTASAVRPGGRVLHLAGTPRTAGFDTDLRRRGLAVEILELYRADPVDLADEAVAAALAGGPIWGASVLSTRAGELLAALAGRAVAEDALASTRFFCISHKAAAPLRVHGRKHVSVSAQPTAAGVLDLLCLSS